MNGSFENGSGNKASPWKSNKSITASEGRQAGSCADGAYCFRMDGDPVASSAKKVMQYVYPTGGPDSNYRFGLAHKVQGVPQGAKFRGDLIFFFSDGVKIKYRNDLQRDDHGWQYSDWCINPGRGVAVTKIKVIVFYTAAGGTIWLDLATLTQCPAGTCPGVTPGEPILGEDADDLE